MMFEAEPLSVGGLDISGSEKLSPAFKEGIPTLSEQISSPGRTPSQSVQGKTSLSTLLSDDGVWESRSGFSFIRDRMLQGEWQSDGDRAISWRLLLGVIPEGTPPSLWAETLAIRRREYQRLKVEHTVDISKAVGDADPLSVSTTSSEPGSGMGPNPWKSFYEHKELLSTIKADLERLYPTGCGEYFLEPHRQELLLSVLSLWAATHPDTSYRQGMHEVLAPLLLVLEKEKKEKERELSDSWMRKAGPEWAGRGEAGQESGRGSMPGGALHVRNDVKQRGEDRKGREQGSGGVIGVVAAGKGDMEADAYCLFRAVMADLEAFYEHGKAAESGEDTPVVGMCHRLQGKRLREADPELQRHLSENDVSPQVSCGRGEACYRGITFCLILCAASHGTCFCL
ncbi:unnamed protein product [Discosporangium mesarthrocarpum]